MLINLIVSVPLNFVMNKLWAFRGKRRIHPNPKKRKEIPCLALLSFHGLATVATLTNYYVDKLRGRPFMLQDIPNAPTAAQVIGGYSFDIEPAAAICLSLMISLFLVAAFLPAIRLNRFSIFRKSFVVATLIGISFPLTSESFMDQFQIMSFNQWDIAGNYEEKNFGKSIRTTRYCNITACSAERAG